MTAKKSARALALEICCAVSIQHRSLTEQLSVSLDQLSDQRDKALCSELCYGFCRYYFVLQAMLEPFLNKPIKPRDQALQVLLLLGFYQLRFTRIKAHAVVSETVSLVKVINKPWAKGLVNAVLRKASQNYASLQSTELNAELHAIAYPSWIRKVIENDWPQDAGEIYRYGNTQPDMLLRFDPQRFESAEYALACLHEAGIVAHHHRLVTTAIVLEKPVSISAIPGFSQGWFSVQDASAQLAANILDASCEERILDACAAPGGKTLHLLQENPQIELTALDKDEKRLQKVAENLRRSGLQASLKAVDAVNTKQWFEGKPFDRILLDAPCSASGIIRRHPDIRLLRREQDIPALAEQQRQLLKALWPLLKPNGYLLYSTCSIFKQENEHQMQQMIEQQDDCTECVIMDHYGQQPAWGRPRPFGRQILPGADSMDGFYYCLLKKRG